MRKSYLFLLLCPFFSWAQFQAPIVVDDSPSAQAGKHITTADLDNDGLQEILVARAGSVDNISVYQNEGNDNFTHEIIDQVSNPVFLATADLDEDGLQDIIALNETNGDLYWYANANGSFSNANPIDTDDSFGKTIVVADFNNDNHQDLAVIWQHAINFYANDGQGNFTKEEILTTETSPNQLECWTMKRADMDNDGDEDLVVGETIGVVIYTNDGQGHFTPALVTPQAYTTQTALTVIDANGDNAKDLSFYHATNDVTLFLQDANQSLSFTFAADVANISTTSIEGMQTTDVNQDGQPDIYLAYNQEPRVWFNNNGSFSQQESLYQSANHFINEVQVTDLDNDGIPEYLWSSASGLLAYQRYDNLSLSPTSSTKIKVYPNPVGEDLHIQQAANDYQNYQLFTLQGKALHRGKLNPLQSVISLENLSEGIYFLRLRGFKGSLTQKLIKK